MAIDYTRPLGQVRLLIADTMEGSFTLADDQVMGFLAMRGATVTEGTITQVRRAAADALDAIAVSEVLVSKVIRTQDLSTDGAKVAEQLRQQAAALRQLADDEDDTDPDGGFEVVEFSPYPAGH